MTIYVCRRCGGEYVTDRTHVMGVRIAQWWAGQKMTCSLCLAKAAQSQWPRGSLGADFEVFHESNPHVYVALVREGRKLLEVGHRKLGIAILYERLRWQVYMETVNAEVKLPNNYRAYYARKIMEQEPDFKGVFNVAQLRSLGGVTT